jgi:hypothetical protein
MRAVLLSANQAAAEHFVTSSGAMPDFASGFTLSWIYCKRLQASTDTGIFPA